MKNLVNKSIGILLILLIMFSTLTGCFGESDIKYSSGDSYIGGHPFEKPTFAKIQSDKKDFDIDDVSFEFLYAFYSLDGKCTLETEKYYHFNYEEGYNYENNFAIYISNSEEILFEYDGNNKIIDYENKVNAKLWKFISFEDMFSTNYGYTTYDIHKLNYNHSEMITIPSEFFTSSIGNVYIHIVCLRHDLDDDTFTINKARSMKIDIEYKSKDGETIEVIN